MHKPQQNKQTQTSFQQAHKTEEEAIDFISG